MAMKRFTELQNTRPFTESEAWWLYRAVALGEAFGWTILITGIAIRHYKLPGHTFAVAIAGQIHGMLFLAYFGILLAVCTSLRWSWRQLLVAVMAGVPPYGSIIFEQWASHARKTAASREHFYSIVWAVLRNKYMELGSRT